MNCSPLKTNKFENRTMIVKISSVHKQSDTCFDFYIALLWKGDRFGTLINQNCYNEDIVKHCLPKPGCIDLQEVQITNAYILFVRN